MQGRSDRRLPGGDGNLGMESEKHQIQFLTLDSLRGFAAIAVAVFHFSAGGWGGYLAVDFFLVLSGFILSHSYLYKPEKTSPAEFIGHRLARLYPLHIYTLVTFACVSLVVAGGLPDYPDGNLFTLLQQITLTHNVGLNPGGMTWNYPSWSISVEFWVNVIFIFFISRNTKNITLALTALFGFILIFLNTGNLDTHAANYYGVINSGMIRGIASFFLGILSYRIYLRYRKYPEGWASRFTYLEAAALLGVLIVVFARKGNQSSLDFAAPFIFMFVVVIFSFEQGRISKFLRMFSYLGTISYSIYLNQITILLLSVYLANEWRASGTLLFIEYILVLLVYSHFTYRFIERPLRIKGRELFNRMGWQEKPH